MSKVGSIQIKSTSYYVVDFSNFKFIWNRTWILQGIVKRQRLPIQYCQMDGWWFILIFLNFKLLLFKILWISSI